MNSLPVKTNRPEKQSRHIQVFSDGCSVCLEHIDNVEIGKCAGCQLDVIPMDATSEEVKTKMDLYRVSIHPTTIIDEEIKIEGQPDFYWQCGGEFYDSLKENYPLSV